MNEKVSIITGASSGIGWAVALRAARNGYRVVISARREDRLNELAGKIRASGGEALVVVGDIALLETQKRLVEEAVSNYGRIDVLVNNAGLPLSTGFGASPAEELRNQWDVNVTALSTLTRLALPYLETTKGTVINIGSSISRFPIPGMGNYAATKIAVASLTDILRMDLMRRGVNVCLVEPGPISTEFGERAGTGGRSPGFSVAASQAAIPIVRLFEHPQRRIVVPAWMGPLLVVMGFMTRLFVPVINLVLLFRAKRMRQADVEVETERAIV